MFWFLSLSHTQTASVSEITMKSSGKNCVPWSTWARMYGGSATMRCNSRISVQLPVIGQEGIQSTKKINEFSIRRVFYNKNTVDNDWT